MKKEYVLKHKNIPVLSFFMDDETHTLLGNGDILDKDRLPFNMQDIGTDLRLGIQTDTWLKGRGIAESRTDKKKIKELFKEKDLKSLAIKSLGLNLTDHYWVHKADDFYKWEDINYFDNDFDKTLQLDNIKPDIDNSVKKPSPNLCVDGSIVKRWVIKRNQRFLVKGSRYSWMQEPFNERIASMIMDEFKIPHVGYDVYRTKEGVPYCECKCMVNRDIEYMNAQWVRNLEDCGMGELYPFYLALLEKNGIKDGKKRIDEMIALDFLIGNEDRHWGNFGIIRNTETLRWEKVADIFDNGNSLLFNCSLEDLKEKGVDSLCKSFENSNRLALDLIDYPEWWKNGHKHGIVDIISQCLKDNERLSSERYDAILNISKDRLDVFEKSVGKKKEGFF